MNWLKILKAVIALADALKDDIPGKVDDYIIELLKKLLEGKN